MSDVFAMPINFAPPAEALETIVHSTDSYHVVIGLDPIGTFLEVSGLSVENPVFTYEELGRNRSPVQLPWEGARKGGEVTLSWGTIIRSRFWNWFQAQSPFLMERQPVFILHLSRRNLPLRVFVLWDAWPKGWEYSDLGNNEVTVEKVTLVYDRMFMLDTALLALQPELNNEVAAEPDLDDPPVLVVPTWTGSTTEPVTFVKVPQRLFDWKPSKTAPAQKNPLAPVEALEEDTTGAAGKFEPAAAEGTYESAAGRLELVPMDEEYKGLAGTWATEALPEDYVSIAGTWTGLDGKKVYGAAGGASGGGGGAASGGGAQSEAATGDGKAVDEEDG